MKSTDSLTESLSLSLVFLILVLQAFIFAFKCYFCCPKWQHLSTYSRLNAVTLHMLYQYNLKSNL